VTLRQRSVLRVIRPATSDDARHVARVQVETWQAAYAHALPVEQLQAMSVDEHERRHGRWPPTFVAERDGQIVGYVAVGRSADEESDGELYAIYVHPEHWGTGIGRALLRAGEERLRELGHTRAVLWVLEDNPRTRRFYELAGWSSDGTAREIELFGFRVPEVRYVKDLGRTGRAIKTEARQDG